MLNFGIRRAKTQSLSTHKKDLNWLEIRQQVLFDYDAAALATLNQQQTIPRPANASANVDKGNGGKTNSNSSNSSGGSSGSSSSSSSDSDSGGEGDEMTDGGDNAEGVSLPNGASASSVQEQPRSSCGPRLPADNHHTWGLFSITWRQPVAPPRNRFGQWFAT
jgi:hypothetical protein